MGYKDAAKQREYQLQWIQKRRRSWIEVNGPCAKCGSWERPEVDHIDPKQKITHAVWSWSKERREAELAKCQVLCHVCHLEKTRKQFEGRHGTRGKYNNGCRCDACREANKIYLRLSKNPYKYSPKWSAFPCNVYYVAETIE